MAERNKKFKPIYIRFAAALIGLIVLQTVIFSLVISSNNVVSSINRNSEDTLQQYASKRSIAIETEMNGGWSDIKESVELANQIMTEKTDGQGLHITEIFDDTALLNSFTSDISQELLDLFRTNGVSDAYLILCNNAEMPDPDTSTDFRGVYFTDSDPFHYADDQSDIIMLKGSSTISSRYNIPMDVSWSSSFSQEHGEISRLDFFFDPVIKAFENPAVPASELGCWSSCTTLKGSSNHSYDFISYSVPLACDGQVYGVIGVSVSVELITNQLPFEEIDEHGHGGYIMVRSNDYHEGKTSFTAQVQAVSGGLVSDAVHCGDQLKLSAVNDSDILSSVRGITINNSAAYCAADVMELYPKDSPYNSDSWLILAMMDEEDLFETSGMLTSRLTLSALLSLGICTLLALLLTILVLRPVNLLSDDAENISETQAAPLRDGMGAEFNAISAALHNLSTERNHCIKEIRSEKERHLMLLKAVDCHIFEYDRTEDILVIYRLENNKEKHTRYQNFRSLVSAGRVCHEDDIPLMLAFTDGTADEEIQIRANEKGGGTRWKSIISRPVADSDGNIVRITACSFDITEQKLEEEKRQKYEQLDKLTGFYSNEYGRMLVKKKILESEDSCYNIAFFSLKNVNNFIQKHGAYYFDGIIEEIGRILRMYSTDDDIIWRKNISDIAVYTDSPDKNSYRDDISNALECISKIYYGDEDENFICQVGISENRPGTSMQEAFDKTIQAECAAEMPIYPDICYYSDINMDVSTRAALISSKYSASTADHNTINSGFIVTDNIISYSLNMFEKSARIYDALNLVFCKTGYNLGFDRMAVYEIDHDFMAIRILGQWCRYELEKLDEKTIKLDKSDFEKMLSISEGKDSVILESGYTINSNVINSIVNEFCGGNKMVIIPSYEKGRLIGCISASIIGDEFSEETMLTLKEICKITVTHILKSKNSFESKAKSDFLSSMSHEIRTPMNAIMGMTAIALHNDELSDETRDCLNKIDSSAKYLLALINDILDMSRIESGKMTVEKAFLDINEIVSQADIINRTRIEEKGNRFSVDCRVKEPYLIGDSMKLKQVLVNILGNAAKFTQNGSISLTVTQEKKQNGDMTFVRFSVKDTGIGISEENLSRIFNSFEQAETSTARKYGGTGLGLSISSSYVGLMGGRLEVTSQLGKGSEFYFTLPMRKASPSEIPAETARTAKTMDFSSKTVLLAEDDELNMEIAKTLLEADGLTVETAENGQKAVDMYNASAAGHYDAILMDIRMPVMDGLEAAKLIRKSERDDADSIPIIAMTANAFDEDMKKSVECGMNGHISKPIDMNRIREVLSEVWSK